MENLSISESSEISVPSLIRQNSSEFSSPLFSPQSKVGGLAHYIKHDLFNNVDKQPDFRSRAAHLTIITDSNGERMLRTDSNPNLKKAINNFIKASSNKSHHEHQYNNLLAQIIAYKNEGREKEVTTINLTIPESILDEAKKYYDDGRPNYKKEIKEAIFKDEKKAIIEQLILKFNEVNALRADLQIEISRTLQEREEIKLSLAKLQKVSKFYDSDKELTTEEREELEQILKENNLTNNKESVINKMKELSISLSSIANKSPKYSSLEKTKKACDKEIDNIVQAFACNVKNGESLLENLPAALQASLTNELIDNTPQDLLVSAICNARGHSEDYLHYLIKNDQEFINNIKQQLPEGADRIYLVIVSTLDACKRCSVKINEVASIMKNNFLSESHSQEETKESEIKKVCKVLYFSTKQMRVGNGLGLVNDYEEPQESDQLSNYEEDALHFKPDFPLTSSPISPSTRTRAYSSSSLGSHDEYEKSRN